MLRLARKVGFEARKSSGLTVELEFDLGQLQRAAGTALADAGVSVKFNRSGGALATSRMRRRRRGTAGRAVNICGTNSIAAKAQHTDDG